MIKKREGVRSSPPRVDVPNVNSLFEECHFPSNGMVAGFESEQIRA